jgi:secreted trypsin-like serine protease
VRAGLVAAVAGLLAPAPADAIVGGTPAPSGRWPWMAAVLNANRENAEWAQYCGGVVIAPRRVLTAAHCVVGERSRDVDVLLGRTRLTTADGRRARVAAISAYPGYVSEQQPSLDAAVLTLAADAGVPALALAQPGQAAAWAPGTPAWTMGWGELNAHRSSGGNRYFADRLRELQLPIQGDDACESAYGTGFEDFPYRPTWLLCAGAGDGRAGPCDGDSGAPLVVGEPGSWLDVGVLSGGDGCAAPGYFDLYARVDRISRFALRGDLTRQPDPAARPRIRGRLVAHSLVRCSRGRWRGSRARFSVRWIRLHDRSHRVRGRGPVYRLERRDASHGVNCIVTATNRGGRNEVAARPLRPQRGGVV